MGICFDSYNDKRTGFEFDLTAGGGEIDLILGNGETEWDTTWDAVWDGKVAHDEKGWTAEFRVPFNQLRYGFQKDQVWGLHAWRWLAINPVDLFRAVNLSRQTALGVPWPTMLIAVTLWLACPLVAGLWKLRRTDL